MEDTWGKVPRVGGGTEAGPREGIERQESVSGALLFSLGLLEPLVLYWNGCQVCGGTAPPPDGAGVTTVGGPLFLVNDRMADNGLRGSIWCC